MADRGNWGNRPAPDWIEPWTWHDENLGVGEVGQMQAEATAQPRRFTLDEHWRRGGYPASLYAPTASRSEDVLDRHIAGALPALPTVTKKGVPIDATGFWKGAARCAGTPLETFRGTLRWDAASFSHVVDLLVDRGAIFTIGYLPDTAKSDLFYFCDSGIWRRVFGKPDEPRYHKYYDRSWEGFVLQLLRFGIGCDADAAVWRRDNDEIDLLLDWPGKPRRLGIEISRSPNKTPSAFFRRASEELGLTEKAIIHRGACDQLLGCRRFTLERFLREFRG